MKFIYAALAAALSFVSGGAQRERALAAKVDDLTTQNNDLTNNLTSLHGAFDALKTDDEATKAALQKSKEDLEVSQDAAKETAQEYADLKAAVDDAAEKSKTLLAAIDQTPSIPVNVTEDGINHDFSHPGNDTRAPGASEVPDIATLPTDPDAPVTNEAGEAPAQTEAQPQASDDQRKAGGGEAIETGSGSAQ